MGFIKKQNQKNLTLQCMQTILPGVQPKHNNWFQHGGKGGKKYFVPTNGIM